MKLTGVSTTAKLVGSSMALLLAQAAGAQVVISAVSGSGGGNAAAVNGDYVELHNQGSAPATIGGWAVHAATATGSFSGLNKVNIPDGTSIAAGGYYLIRMETTGVGTAYVADQVASPPVTVMGAGAGLKVALTNTTNALSGTCPVSAAIVDFVGGRTTAVPPAGSPNCFEGAGPAPSQVFAQGTGLVRLCRGAQDTNNNAADFRARPFFFPRNSSSPANPGGPDLGVFTVTSTTTTPTTSVRAGGGTFVFTAETNGCGGTLAGVTINLTSIGGPSAAVLVDDGTNGDAIAGDGIFTITTTAAANTVPGDRTVTVVASDTLSRTASANTLINVLAPIQQLKISQYSAGAGATFATDYTEIYNAGLTSASLAGYSLQWQAGTAASTTWAGTALPPVTIPPGGYFLISHTQFASPGTALVPDFTVTGSPYANSGGVRLALVASPFVLTGTCPVGLNASIVDFVGAGALAVCREGASAADNAPYGGFTSTAGFRRCAGSQDTGINAADFTLGFNNPRNSLTTPVLGGPSLVNTQISPTSASAGDTITITTGVECVSLAQIGSLIVDLSGIGGPLSAALVDDGTGGDAVAGDGIFTFTFMIPGAQPPGASTVTLTVTDVLSRTSSQSLGFAVNAPAFPLKISQVYDAGGLNNLGFDRNYLEIYNASDTAASLEGYSLQLAIDSNNWFVYPLSGTIPGRSYSLVTISAGLNLGLPPTASGDFNFAANPFNTLQSATENKWAIVRNQVPLTATCPTGDLSVVDFMSTGAVDCIEGTAALSAAIDQYANFRECGGETDTGNSGADFNLGNPAPRNSLSPANTLDAAYTVRFPVGEFDPVPPVGVPGSTVLIVARAETCAITPISVSADLTNIGGPANFALNDAGLNGDVTAGDNLFSANFTIPGAQAFGSANITATTTDAASRTSSATGRFIVKPAAADVRISQAYGFGGFSANGPNADYVELFNPGTTAVDLTGWSVQLWTNFAVPFDDWTVIPLTGTIAPRSYYLVRVEAERATGTPLPTPDVSIEGVSILGSGGGEIALVASTDRLRGFCPTDDDTFVIDFLGYVSAGGALLCAETTNGPAAAGQPLAQTRRCGGDIDTDSNGADFAIVTPAPRNSDSDPNGGIFLATTFTPANSVLPGGTVLIQASPVTCTGTAPILGATLTVDLSPFGGSPAQPLLDDGLNGDVTAGDGIYTFSFNVPLLQTPGSFIATFSATDGTNTGSSQVSYTILTPPLGACCFGDGTLITCSLQGFEQCTALGGRFEGVGIPCRTVVEGQPLFSYNGAPALPADIPDDSAGGVALTFNIADSFLTTTAEGIAVRLNLNHGFLGDLTATISDGVNTVTLFERVGRIGGSGFGYDAGLQGTYRFVDSAVGDFWREGLVAQSAGGVVASADYRPSGVNNTAQSLATFANQPLDGTWTLVVSDNEAGNGGVVQGFAVEYVETRQTCCKADFNRDGIVNDDDLGEFITAFFEIFPGPGGFANPLGCPGADAPFDTLGYRADTTNDCSLNDDDLGAFITFFFNGCPE